MTLPFQILCPDGVVTQDEANLVVVPGVEGDLGVLLGHSAMIVQLRRGTVASFTDGRKVSARYYVDGGTAHITPKGLTVLSDMSCALETLDVDSLPQGDARADAQRDAVKNPVYS